MTPDTRQDVAVLPNRSPEHARSERVLDALIDIIQFDTDRAFASLAQRRFCDLTDRKEAP